MSGVMMQPLKYRKGIGENGSNNEAANKYFAETVEHAAEWEDAFYGEGGYGIIEVELPTSVANEFYRWEVLDRIDPAPFAQIEQLQNVDMIIRVVR